MVHLPTLCLPRLWRLQMIHSFGKKCCGKATEPIRNCIPLLSGNLYPWPRQRLLNVMVFMVLSEGPLTLSYKFFELNSKLHWKAKGNKFSWHHKNNRFCHLKLSGWPGQGDCIFKTCLYYRASPIWAIYPNTVKIKRQRKARKYNSKCLPNILKALGSISSRGKKGIPRVRSVFLTKSMSWAAPDAV